MEPQASPGTVSHLRAANASFAAVLAAGCFYLVAAPQLEGDLKPEITESKQGPTRPTAVQNGGLAQTAATSSPTSTTSSPTSTTGVKVIGTSTEGGKPCDEQTWPYIEARCLTVADGKPAPAKAERSATPLGLRDLLAGIRPAPGGEAASGTRPRDEKEQPVGSVTAIAPTPAVRDMQANTVGVPSADTTQATTDGVAKREDGDVPIPQPRPDVTFASLPASAFDDARATPARPPMSRAEYRRMEREQRRAAREFERERRRQEWAERRAANPERIVRRWTEYSYEDDSRTVVIQQGSQRDRFFRYYR